MAKVQELSKQVTKDVSFESVVTNAIKIPGVKVDRVDFLRKVFEKEDVDVERILEEGPVIAGCSEKMLARMANKLILTRTSESTAISFAAGIPGGLAMAATIPADTLQFFGMTLRLAQELTYLYGASDLWKNGEVDSDKVRDQLILYCGVMFGVAGASAGVRLLSAQVAKQALKKLPQKALTKHFWYRIVKQICKIIGIKMTKDTAAKGISKAVPVIGGVVSGGMTFLSMRPMGKRLADVLDEANFEYTEEKAMEDYIIVEGVSEESDVCEETCQAEEDIEGETATANAEEIFDKLEKLAKLNSVGAITDEEFNQKKTELLSRI